MKKFVITIFICTVMALSVIPASYSEGISVTQDPVNTESSAKFVDGVWKIPVNKQIQITADVVNNQDRPQPFAYLVQIQNQDGVVISLSWLTGSLDSTQTLSPAQSWLPTIPGLYTAQIFIWQGIDNPDALSSPLTMKIQAI